MLTAEQLEKRKLGIGGSDAAAITGKNLYKTPLEVYLNKMGIEIPLTPEQEERCYWGNIWEPIVLKEYEKRTGEISLPLNSDTAHFFKDHHETYPWMRANIDGYILNKNIIIECKSAKYKDHHWGNPGTDEIPDSYLLQCAHYAIVYDAVRVDLAVLFGNNDFNIYHYNRNPALEEKLIEKEHIFWHEHVLKEIPPDPINLSDSNLLWPDSLSNSKVATNDTYMTLCQYDHIKSKIKEMKKEADDLKLKVQIEMGESDTLVNANNEKLATWKTQPRKSYFVKESSSRVFRLGKLD